MRTSALRKPRYEEPAPVFDPIADPRTDFALAYASAQCDALELEWLGASHTQAWNRHDHYTQIVCLKRIAAITGRPFPARGPFDRRDAFQKDQDEYAEEMRLVAAEMGRG